MSDSAAPMGGSLRDRPGKRSEPFRRKGEPRSFCQRMTPNFRDNQFKLKDKHKFLNRSIPPKNSAHSPPPLDVFDTFNFISGKKILMIQTSPEGF